MPPGLKGFVQRWIINTLAVLVAATVLPGIRYDGSVDLVVASLLLGILNSFLRPILMLLALPLVVFTLGLFILVINALILDFVNVLVPGFHVDSFGWALAGALIIGIVSLTVNILVGRGSSRLQFTWRRRPPGPDHRDGGGPVIDV